MNLFKQIFLVIVIYTTVFTQEIPDSFQGIELGTDQMKFILEHDVERLDFFYVWGSDVEFSSTDRYRYYSKTSSGDKIEIITCFYEKKLYAIIVEYEKYQFWKTLIAGLENKYGNYSSHTQKKYVDPINGKYRTIQLVNWLKHPRYALEFIFIDPIGVAKLVFYDKKVEQKILKKKAEKNQSIIE